MKKEVIFYQKTNWDIPVKKFLDSLKIKNPQMLAKILSKIDLLSQDLLWEEDIKFLKEKVYELRVKKSTDISRILYFTITTNSIVILDWIIKKDQKLNKDILDKMIIYKNDYLAKN